MYKIKNNLVAIALTLFTILLIMPAYAQTTEQTAEQINFIEKYNDAISLLSGIGVVDGKSVTNENISEPVTKGNFAEMLVKLINIQQSDAQEIEGSVSEEKPTEQKYFNYQYNPEEDKDIKSLAKESIAINASSENSQSEADQGKAAVYFADVPAESPVYQSVGILVNMGILSNKNDKLFHPEENITIKDGIEMLVKALGYGVKAELGGGLANHYLKVANDIGLLNGVLGANESQLKYYDTYRLMENALGIDLFEISGIQDSEMSFDSTKGATILSEYHKITKLKAKITKNQYTSLVGGATPPKECVALDDGNVYAVGNTNAKDLVGFYVNVYYKEIDGKNVLMAVIPVKNQNTVMIINGEDFIRYSQGKLYYLKNDKETYVNTVKAFDLIYNNKKETQADGVFENVNRIRMIDHNSDGMMDTVFVNSYSTIPVNNVNSYEEIVFTNHTTASTLYLNDSSVEYIIEDETGKTLKLDDIRQNNILNYFESKDHKLKRIVVSSKTDNGKVTECLEDGIVLNDKTYEYNRSFLAEYPNGIKPDGSVTVYLDLFGKIAAMKEGAISGEVKTGFLIDAKEKSGIADCLELMLCDDFGKILIYPTASKLKYSGPKRKSDTQADYISANYSGNEQTQLLTQLRYGEDGFSQIKDDSTYSFDLAGQVVRRVVQYSLNSKGEIFKLTLAKIWSPEDMGNGLFLVYKNTDASKTPMTSTRAINAAVGSSQVTSIKPSTLVFTVPPMSLKEESNQYKAGVDGQYFLGDTKQYYIDSYITNADNITADIIVDKLISSAAGADTDADVAQYILIEKIVDCVDKDGETTQKIYGYTFENGRYNVPSKYLEFTAESATTLYPLFDKSGNKVTEKDTEGKDLKDSQGNSIYKKLGAGDFISYLKNVSGELTSVRLHFDASEFQLMKNMSKPVDTTDPLLVNKIFYAMLHSRDDYNFALTSGPESVDKGYYNIYKVSMGLNFLVDQSSGSVKILPMTLDQVPQTKYSGINPYKVLLVLRYGYPAAAIIYKDDR